LGNVVIFLHVDEIEILFRENGSAIVEERSFWKIRRLTRLPLCWGHWFWCFLNYSYLL